MDLHSSIKCHVYHHVGGRRHTRVVCDESREPHTSRYPSNKKNNQQTTHTSTIQYTGRKFLKSYNDIWIWDSLPKPILPNSAKCPYLAHFAEIFSAKWASEFGKVGIEIRQSGQGSCLHLQKQTFWVRKYNVWSQVTWLKVIWLNFFVESFGLKILSQVTTKLSQLHSNSRNK